MQTMAGAPLSSPAPHTPPRLSVLSKSARPPLSSTPRAVEPLVHCTSFLPELYNGPLSSRFALHLWTPALPPSSCTNSTIRAPSALTFVHQQPPPTCLTYATLSLCPVNAYLPGLPHPALPVSSQNSALPPSLGVLTLPALPTPRPHGPICQVVAS